MGCAKTPGEGARDAADGKPIDGGADIARSRRRMRERKDIKARKIFTVYERPAHLLAPHHADRSALDSIAGETAKHAAVGRVDHRRGHHDAVDVVRSENALEL